MTSCTLRLVWPMSAVLWGRALGAGHSAGLVQWLDLSLVTRFGSCFRAKLSPSTAEKHLPFPLSFQSICVSGPWRPGISLHSSALPLGTRIWCKVLAPRTQSPPVSEGTQTLMGASA